MEEMDKMDGVVGDAAFEIINEVESGMKSIANAHGFASLEEYDYEDAHVFTVTLSTLYRASGRTVKETKSYKVKVTVKVTEE